MISHLLQESERGLQSFDMSDPQPEQTSDEMPLSGMVHGVDLALLGAALDEVRGVLGVVACSPAIPGLSDLTK
jgi:hypothetical protein